MSHRATPILPNSRATIADYLNPDNGYRGKMERLGHKPKDHLRQNVRELRELQTRKLEQRELQSQSPKALYKLPQFREVSPRLYVDENKNVEKVNVDFLSKGESERRRDELAQKSRQERLELEARMEELRIAQEKPSTPRKPKIPKAYETSKLLPRSNSDFIKKNRVEAITMHPKQEVEEIKEVKHEEYGQVPKYLEERKAQWEKQEQDRRRRVPDPNCPPGMKIMSESERIDTLAILTKSKEELGIQFRKLPFVVETPSMINKKNELEKKLKEVENAIELFSRPKVYVKL